MKVEILEALWNSYLLVSEMIADDTSSLEQQKHAIVKIWHFELE